MKTTKRLIAMAAALTLTACAAAPITMMNVGAEGTGSIVINNATEGHEYVAYKIFDGTLKEGGNDTSGKLKVTGWGSGVDSDGIIGKLESKNAGFDKGTTDDSEHWTTAEDIAALLVNNQGLVNDFAKVIGSNLSATVAASTDVCTGGKYTISGLEDGYYLVKDKDSKVTGTYDTNTSYIIRVAGKAENIEPKISKPTVSKDVSDESNEATNTGTVWGKAADHAIGEVYSYKLTATLNRDTDYAAYDTYKIKFNDKLNAGVTMVTDSEPVVIISDGTKTISVPKKDTTNTNGWYYASPISPNTGIGAEFSIAIDDIKAYITATDGAKWANEADVTVTVEYKAFLNGDAAVENENVSGAATTYANVNNVDLEYSNNPSYTGDGESLGKTEKEYVWTFAYRVNNTKHKLTTDGDALEGAEFEIRTGSADSGTAISLIYDATNEYYRPALSGETGLTKMISASDGKFDIAGLDAGTYYLVETKAPNGYNVADPTTITIGATHTRSADNKGVLTLEGDATSIASNDIADTEAGKLPTTGGTGTKVLYAIGGTILVGAGMVLVSKKRAQK